MIKHLTIGKRNFDLSRSIVMGILNVTPDWFSDGGRFYRVDRAVEHALQMQQEGADIIDIGGESTRPGASEVGVSEELDRVIPVIRAIRRQSDIPVSVDTSKAEVMRQAVGPLPDKRRPTLDEISAEQGIELETLSERIQKAIAAHRQATSE